MDNDNFRASCPDKSFKPVALGIGAGVTGFFYNLI